jgi:hypothetical protein
MLALGLGLASQQANALIAVASNTFGVSSAEMTLIMFDSTSNTGYVRDLGMDWNPTTLTSALTSSQSFAGDANYQTFLSTLGGSTTSTTFWGVYSGYSIGTSVRLLTTYGANTTMTSSNLGANFTNNKAGAVETYWQDLAYAVNGAIQNTTNTMGALTNEGNSNNGSIVTTAADGIANVSSTWSLGFGQASNLVNYAGGAEADLTADFYVLTKNTAASGTAKMPVTKLSGTWTLDAVTGGLVYASSITPSVPEPQNSTLALVGLVLIGASVFARHNTDD